MSYYEPGSYVKEIAKNLENFTASLLEKIKALEERIKKLESK